MKRELERLNSLKQERASKLEAQNALIESRSEDHAWSDEEKQKFNDIDEEVRSLDADIEFLEKQIEVKKRNATMASDAAAPEVREKAKIQKAFNIQKALGTLKRGQSLEGVEAEVHQMGVEEMRSAGIQVSDNSIVMPSSFLRASDETSPSQTVTEDDGLYGGALVNDAAPRFVQHLVPDLPFEQFGMNVLTGLVGNLPLVSAEEYEFDWYEETEEISEQKVKFNRNTLSPKRLAAMVGISNQLLIQTSGNAQNLVMNMLRQAQRKKIVETILNGAGTMSTPNGDNKLEPTGILNLSNVLQGTETGVPTYKAIVELEALLSGLALNPANMAYVFGNKLVTALKTTTVDTGSGKFILDGSTLNGYNYAQTPLMPTLDEGSSPTIHNSPIIFGDWSQAYLGFWGGAEFIIDPYTRSHANTTRVVVNTHADFGVANEKAFAVNKKMKFGETE